jgi:hypothetical protein
MDERGAGGGSEEIDEPRDNRGNGSAIRGDRVAGDRGPVDRADRAEGETLRRECIRLRWSADAGSRAVSEPQTLQVIESPLPARAAAQDKHRL